LFDASYNGRPPHDAPKYRLAFHKLETEEARPRSGVILANKKYVRNGVLTCVLGALVILLSGRLDYTWYVLLPSGSLFFVVGAIALAKGLK
jgi:hypothetical protein